MPHTFQKQHPNLIASCVVIQFRGDFWGDEFLDLPECKPIKQLLALASIGFKINSSACGNLGLLIKDLEFTEGLRRVLKLCECLLQIEQLGDNESLSTYVLSHKNAKETERIDKVIQFTVDSFQKDIKLSEVASLINSTVSSFCRYFRKCTKKTYISFLNEVRVGHACKLLTNSKMSITNICYESGFGTIANFNKQFLQIKKLTPSQYRKHFGNQEL